ncbi:MAG: glutamyl-tRNA reductase, partial [Syntrophomonadaceae bacterium]|nr:glutamyl-tRNA reductase [Syntrophomonadaceae bacterium]
MFIILVGLNHRSAPVEVRERLSVSESQYPEVLRAIKKLPGIEGCIVLSTCNRLEIYATVRDIQPGIKNIRDYLNQLWQRNQDGDELMEPLNSYLYTLSCQEAINHLFRVAAGLDSMIIGESQILGQVREAYDKALKNKVTNGVINTLFQQAISIGKRVRSETAIGNHAVSVGYAAVEMAKQLLKNLEGQSVLIVGAGEIGELAVRHLVACGATSVMVSNRSYERALALAEEFCGVAKKFDDLEQSLAEADIVICCTAACHYVVRRQQVARAMSARGQRPMVIIDIAVPRDVEPEVGSIEGVHLYDIDDLNGIVSRTAEGRQQAVEHAERIIEEHVREFMDWQRSLAAAPVIRGLQGRLRRIAEEELERYSRRLSSLDERQQALVRELAHSLVNKITHHPITHIKDYARSRG